MVAGEVLLEGEAGLFSLFYNSTTNGGKLTQRCDNWTLLTVMSVLPVLTVLLKSTVSTVFLYLQKI